jgi:hypothetical protein
MVTVARLNRCMELLFGWVGRLSPTALLHGAFSTSRVHAARASPTEVDYIFVSVESGSATRLHAWGLRDRFRHVGTISALSVSN